MSEQSRDRIFARLRAAAATAAAVPGAKPEPPPTVEYSQPQKIEKLKTLMEAMRTEVHITSDQGWLELLEEILRQRKLKDLLYGPRTPIGEVARPASAGSCSRVIAPTAKIVAVVTPVRARQRLY